MRNMTCPLFLSLYIVISTYVLNTCRLTLGSYGKAWFICWGGLLFPGVVVVSYKKAYYGLELCSMRCPPDMHIYRKTYTEKNWPTCRCTTSFSPMLTLVMLELLILPDFIIFGMSLPCFWVLLFKFGWKLIWFSVDLELVIITPLFFPSPNMKKIFET